MACLTNGLLACRINSIFRQNFGIPTRIAPLERPRSHSTAFHLYIFSSFRHARTNILALSKHSSFVFISRRKTWRSNTAMRNEIPSMRRRGKKKLIDKTLRRPWQQTRLHAPPFPRIKRLTHAQYQKWWEITKCDYRVWVQEPKPRYPPWVLYGYLYLYPSIRDSSPETSH